jgi:quinol---cytochrome-c reductase cytochrome c subunit
MPLAALVVLTAGTATAHRTPAAPSAVDARAIFLRDCAVCHGAAGSGTERGPSLVHVGAAALDFWVSTGRMPLDDPDQPPERSTPKYSRRRIDALVRYATRLTGGGPPIPRIATSGADTAAGGQLFRLNCAACHAWAGDGGALNSVTSRSARRPTPSAAQPERRTPARSTSTATRSRPADHRSDQVR